MKYLSLLALLCAAAAAHADIPNEAVRMMPNGKRVVEEPPGPRGGGYRPQTRPSHWNPASLGSSYVIDTSAGLKECAWPWPDAGCRDYVPKRDRRERAWVVKHGGQWMKCPQRDSAAGCVGYYEPPVMAVQD